MLTHCKFSAQINFPPLTSTVFLFARRKNNEHFFVFCFLRVSLPLPVLPVPVTASLVMQESKRNKWKKLFTMKQNHKRRKQRTKINSNDNVLLRILVMFAVCCLFTNELMFGVSGTRLESCKLPIFILVELVSDIFLYKLLNESISTWREVVFFLSRLTLKLLLPDSS